MNDPTDESALRFVSAAAGMVVRPMIAGPSDIAAAIRAYYYGEEPSTPPDDPTKKPAPAPTPAKPPPPKPPAPVMRPKPKKEEPIEEFPQDFIEEWESGVHQLSDVEAHLDKRRAALETQKKAHREREVASQPAQTIDQPAIATAVESIHPPPNQNRSSENPAPALAGPDPSVHASHQRQVERHMFGVGQSAGKPKTLSLTLLDGTTLSFGKQHKEPEKETSSLSVEEFLKALRAATEGPPPEGVLPSVKWEDHLAALLDVLFRKHLVSYEEYLEALKKQ